MNLPMLETVGPHAAHNSLMEEGAEQYCSARSWCAVTYEPFGGPTTIASLRPHLLPDP
jgi:hypothetical protein